MKRITLIGGTGAVQVVPPDRTIVPAVTTPHGEPSSPIFEWQAGNSNFSFISRHGLTGTIPPHRVNYKANIWAVRETQPDYVIGLNAVGGIAAETRPTCLIFPDQLVDYTWGRQHTFADGADEPVKHIDFTRPISRRWRQALVERAEELKLDFLGEGTYGVTQGPRLETAAEIDRLERDGCHIVGMTAMPEAALAREIGLDYVICAVVVNWAAGRGPSGTGIHDEIQQYLDGGMRQVKRLLSAL
jgi:5'-methylthioinosine phosphorylase